MGNFECIKDENKKKFGKNPMGKYPYKLSNVHPTQNLI